MPPRRWLSRRGRREETGQLPMTTPRQGNFDFAFDTPSKLVSNNQKTPKVSLPVRPTTSAGEDSRSRKKLRLDSAFSRPRSSEGMSPIFTKKLHLTRLEDGMIGVAFGSPGHPPEAFTSLPSGTSPGGAHHPFAEMGPLPLPSPQASRWKKLGGLFRTKSLAKSSNRQQTTQLDTEKKLGVPIDRKPWRNPRSPRTDQDEFPATTETSASSHEKADSSTDRPVSVWPSFLANEEDIRPDAPKLELKIPQTPLDRFSVMFKDVDGARSSTLLARRNQNLKNLKTGRIDEGTSGNKAKLTTPVLTRPLTSPTVSSSPAFTPDSRSASSTASKYSLFPSNQQLTKPTIQPAAIKTRMRSLTAPSRMSPMQETFEEHMPSKEDLTDPNHKQSENIVISPDETVASAADREAVPWNSVESVNKIPSSRTSVDDEIFFDVKSFRDSKGVDGQQFMMTRPDSTAVQLARSQSSARKLKQAQDSSPIEIFEIKDQGPTRTSIQIEETIAAVEKLTSPSSTHLPLSSPKIFELDAVDTCIDDRRDSTSSSESIIIAVDRRPPPLSTLRRKTSLKTRLENMNIDVPSPVIEQAEEASPSSPFPHGSIAASISPVKLTQSREISPLSENMPAQNTSEISLNLPTPPTRAPPPPPSASTSEAIPSPPSRSPPAVPVKDAKFIPISKFAAKNTAEMVTERTGLRPNVRTRSATVNFGSFSERTSSLPPSALPFKLERSYTMPDLTAQDNPQQSQHASPPPVTVSPESKQPPTVVAYVQPVAEVSVARTVSLSRRPSQKVLVPGPLARKASQKSGAGRVSIDEDENVVERQTRALLPVVREVEKGHKPGRSMNLIVEIADLANTKNQEQIPKVDSNTVSPQSSMTDEELNINFSC